MSQQNPQHYPYLIIGGGMTGDAAARGIRAVDPDQPIGLIGQEPDPPYNRPPLSKGLWKRGPRPMPLSRIWRNTAKLGIELLLGKTVTAVNPKEQIVMDAQDNIYHYDQLLLATGGTPIRIGPESERIIYYRTLGDYQRLRALSDIHQRFVVVGGGFIGSEMAAALSIQGKEVTIIFPETGIGARALPEEISLYLNQFFREHGINVLTGQLVTGMQAGEDGVTLQTNTGETLQADGVVAGLGIRPNVALAESAGLVTGNGIHVNEFMQTSAPNIYAAGDVANFYNPTLKMRMRVEHEENANVGGMLAGQAMAGQPAPYSFLPSVYSTLFDINYDAVGHLDPSLEIIYDWQEPYQKGTAYYLNESRVRGVLLWNQPKGLDIARALIAEPGPFHAQDLLGRI